MIYLYSGTPGSGKSLHMAKDILTKLRVRKQNVIANFPIDENVVSRGFLGRKINVGQFIYKDNSEMTVQFLVDYARKNHKIGKEGQALICLDECQIIFNPREFQRKDRLQWIEFFTQHRKLGYNVILVTQNDRLLDRQIRALIEYEYRHRKVNNFKIGQLLPFKCFVSVQYWYGVKERLGAEFFTYQKRLGKLYDSYKMFDDIKGTEEPKQPVKQNTVVFKPKETIQNIEEETALPTSSGGSCVSGGDLVS